MEGLFLIIIVFFLVGLFFISFALFIRRLMINSSVNNSNDLGGKIDKLIKQNEQILLLLKEKKLD